MPRAHVHTQWVVSQETPGWGGGKGRASRAKALLLEVTPAKPRCLLVEGVVFVAESTLFY